MPVIRCPNGKYRIGSGPCIYKSKQAADRAYRGYLYSQAHGRQTAEVIRRVRRG